MMIEESGFSLRLCPGIGFKYERVRICDPEREYINIRYNEFDSLLGFDFGLFWKPDLDDSLKYITWKKKIYWPLSATISAGKGKLKKFLVTQHFYDGGVTVNKSNSVIRMKYRSAAASCGCINPVIVIDENE